MSRLVCYGSLQPGGINHHELGEARHGTWEPCSVRAQDGMIGPWRIVTLDDKADPLPMQLLTSDRLEAMWPSLDAFEGQAYRRVPCTAQTASGPVMAYIYEASGLPLEEA